mmetsp:Transcript_32530/g.105078  ORF Transcript_32530/g.105078 Transcript_32530/m.105078 type:complete len:259 (-) Transcript_32530:233-1009(-)
MVSACRSDPFAAAARAASSSCFLDRPASLRCAACTCPECRLQASAMARADLSLAGLLEARASVRAEAADAWFCRLTSIALASVTACPLSPMAAHALSASDRLCRSRSSMASKRDCEAFSSSRSLDSRARASSSSLPTIRTSTAAATALSSRASSLFLTATESCSVMTRFTCDSRAISSCCWCDALRKSLEDPTAQPSVSTMEWKAREARISTAFRLGEEAEEPTCFARTGAMSAAVALAPSSRYPYWLMKRSNAYRWA